MDLDDDDDDDDLSIYLSIFFPRAFGPRRPSPRAFGNSDGETMLIFQLFSERIGWR